MLSLLSVMHQFFIVKRQQFYLLNLQSLKREIFRRIETIPKITYEPHMLKEEAEDQENGKSSPKKRPCHYFRMKAVDDAKNLGMYV